MAKVRVVDDEVASIVVNISHTDELVEVVHFAPRFSIRVVFIHL